MRVEGNASYRGARKLEVVKTKIKRWRKKEWGIETVLTQFLLQDLEDLDHLEGNGRLSTKYLARRESITPRGGKQMQMQMQEIQKSKARWIKGWG